MRWFVNHRHESTIGRHSLSHALAGVPAPSEREPGNVPIHRAGQKPQRCGRFSSPLRNSKVFYIPPFNERHSLSHARWACQLPQRGSREAFPFIVPVGNRNVAGDFHRPYATQKFFTFHHSAGDTPSVTPIRACQLPQRGSWEGRVPFIASVQKLRGGTGRWRFGWWLRPGR